MLLQLQLVRGMAHVEFLTVCTGAEVKNRRSSLFNHVDMCKGLSQSLIWPNVCSQMYVLREREGSQPPLCCCHVQRHDSCVRLCRPWHVALYSAPLQQQLGPLFSIVEYLNGK